MPKPPGKCIFCGQTGLTKEHIWPDWLRDYIPRQIQKSHFKSAVFHRTHTEERTYAKPGDPHSHRLRIVCKPCNTGWMSRPQDTTKSILIPLLFGEHTTVELAHQKALATWATMAVMVAEHTERDKVAIPFEQRERFRLTREPLPEWRIWLASYDREQWAGHYSHMVFPITTKEHVPETLPNDLPRPNTQTTTLVEGKLYIHALSTSVPEAARFFRFVGSGSKKVNQIWPSTSSAFEWPPVSLTDVEAHKMSEAFFARILEITRGSPR
jgi:hypothetical protein